jgi:hypothetical protein
MSGFKFPWIPLASFVAAALGAGGLLWYYSLSEDDQAKADALAAEHAQRLYGKAVHELTAGQRSQVNALVKGHFAD